MAGTYQRLKQIKGEILEENEITVQGNVDGDIQCKDLIVGKTGSIKGKIKADTLYVVQNVALEHLDRH